MENRMEVPQKELKVKVPYDPAVPLLGIYPKEMKTGSQRDIRTPCYCSTIHNSQDLEIIQVSFNELMHEEDILQIQIQIYHTYNGVLFSLEKEGNSAVWDNMDGLKGIMLSEISQREKDKYCIPLICGI